jgi:uncharacterized membrane protein YjjB (DUF3815 family)
MEALIVLENGIWFGFAALGFAILFNVPQRSLFMIFVLAALGGLVKLLLFHMGANIVLSSFGGASLIGILSIPASHNKHAPPLVFAIPAVIPMVPGVFAYQMVLGLMQLSGDSAGNDYLQILSETVNNGLKVLFILMSLAVGVATPMLVTRKSSGKHITFRKRRKPEPDNG